MDMSAPLSIHVNLDVEGFIHKTLCIRVNSVNKRPGSRTEGRRRPHPLPGHDDRRVVADVIPAVGEVDLVLQGRHVGDVDIGGTDGRRQSALVSLGIRLHVQREHGRMVVDAHDARADIGGLSQDDARGDSSRLAFLAQHGRLTQDVRCFLVSGACQRVSVLSVDAEAIERFDVPVLAHGVDDDAEVRAVHICGEK